MSSQSHLFDQDELLRSCYDPRSRELMAEAINCYKAGAYRAAIVSSWIGLVFDYIYKLYELGECGEKQPEQEAEEFFRRWGQNDIQWLLTFEKSVLANAEKHGFINQHERAELFRLYEDRNNCAHPSLDATHDPYRPTAELARYHIRNVIEKMCKFPPTLGGGGPDEIWKVIKSPSFPDADVARAKLRLKSTPLGRMKEVHLKGLINSIRSAILVENYSGKQRDQVCTALRAIAEEHQGLFDELLQQGFLKKVARLDDAQIFNTFRFLRAFPEALRLLDEGQMDRLESQIKNASKDDFDDVAHMQNAALIPHFAPLVCHKLASLNAADLAALVEYSPTEELLDISVIAFENNVTSFEKCETYMDLLINPFASKFTSSQLARVLNECSTNGDIIGAYKRFPAKLKRLMEDTEPLAVECAAEWKKLIKSLTVASNNSSYCKNAYSTILQTLKAKFP